MITRAATPEELANGVHAMAIALIDYAGMPREEAFAKAGNIAAALQDGAEQVEPVISAMVAPVVAQLGFAARILAVFRVRNAWVQALRIKAGLLVVSEVVS